MPPAAPRPYRDFLMPALHRRFVSASIYSALVCYVISIWQGQWTSWIWSWFPLGTVGVRAGFLCISVLFLLIPRVAQFHVGERNTTSPLETVWKYALSKQTAVTLVAYVLSAFFFCEIYIWSRPQKSRLGFTDPGKLHERIRLNERPLFLRFLFTTLALMQGVIHLWKDYDRIRIGAVKPKKEKKDETPKEDNPQRQLFSVKKLTAFIWHGVYMATIAFSLGITLYYGGLRYVLWEWHARIARIYFTFAKSTKPTSVAPFLELVLMYVAEAPLLGLLWAFVNEAFNIYMAQEPLKGDRPITSDSKDPNGSLLNGLKSKKEQVRNVAFWELAIITDRFADRRKTMYSELERKRGPTCKQIVDLCAIEVKEVVRRIEAVEMNHRAGSSDSKQAPEPPINLVPRISQPLKDGQITAPAAKPTTRLEILEHTTERLARLHSSPQNVEKSKALQLIKTSQGKLTEGAQKAESTWEIYKHNFASSPLGWPLRHSLHRTANTVINGAPYSRQSMICNAVTTLTNLAVYSLKEDEFGQFQKLVPEIVSAFTTTIKAIETYMQGMEVHWTDVDTLALPEAERKKVPEVEEVVDSLKSGLERVLGSFNEYLNGMGMTRMEIQEAKNLVVKAATPA